MTRVWSMATEQSNTQESAQFHDNFCTPRGQSHSHPEQTRPSSSLAPPAPQPPPLPPDTDSGYEASPSSATRLISFQFGGLIQADLGPTTTRDNLDDELLSIDIFPSIHEEEDSMDYESSYDSDENEHENHEITGNGLRTSSSNSFSDDSSGSDRLISTPIPIPLPIGSSSSSSSSRMLRDIDGSNGSQNSHVALSLTHLSSISLSSSSLPLGQRNMIVAMDNNNDERFNRGVMFVGNNNNNWNRYHIGMTFSPHSPPQTYWSPHLLNFVASNGQVAHNNHNNNNNNNNRNNTNRNNTNNHNHNRYSGMAVNHRASISLPIDEETVRAIGTTLRQISDEFEFMRTRNIEMLSNSEPNSYGMMRNIFASVRLSRRSLSSRFRSNRINTNGRPRSFSTNDADAAADFQE